MSKLAHSNDDTIHEIDRQRMIEDGDEPDYCIGCGAPVDDDGMSVHPDYCCWYCKAD